MTTFEKQLMEKEKELEMGKEKNKRSEELGTLLPFEGSSYKDGTRTLESYGSDGDLLIRYGQMYDRPTFTLNQAIALQKFFDCEDIRQGEFSHSGCDTCDWGSCYGHELHIVKPKKNQDLVGDI